MDSTDETAIRDGITMRRLCELDALSVDYVEVASGSQEFLVVHHECDEAWYVLDGTLEATVAGRTWTVTRGDCVAVPRDAPHGSRNTSDDVVRLLVVNSPPWRPEHDHEPA